MNLFNAEAIAGFINDHTNTLPASEILLGQIITEYCNLSKHVVDLQGQNETIPTSSYNIKLRTVGYVSHRYP